MSRRLDTLSDYLDHGADTLIDVRSPAEFAEDHIPGARNLPALSDAERAEIGTIYVQDSPFKARKQGAALVARNVAAHLEGPLAQMEGGWQPLVYCWRGGQRSGSVASILSQIGWRAETIAGGYQSFRRLVVGLLHHGTLPHRLILLDGNTGTGKTAILTRLAAMGVQVVDLEGLAHHRGSLLGGDIEEQPAQKMFETRLAAAFTRSAPDRPVVLEAESSTIGRINLPPAVWSAMKRAPRIMVTAPLPSRARYLARAYAEIAADPATLTARLAPLRRVRGQEVVDRWQGLLADGAFEDLAAALMRDHYDPAYMKSRGAIDADVLGTVAADSLDEQGLDDTARKIAAMITPSG